LLNLTAVILPLIGFVAVVFSLWGRGFHWVDGGLLVGMYVLTSLGITVGFHRLFTHRSFETNRVVQFFLAVLGSMAVEGPLLKWVAVHRRHHQHSDTHEDPHSPHEQGDGLFGQLRGLWHAHMGWFFQPDPPNLHHYVKDLNQSGLLRTASKLFPLWVTLGVLIPAALGARARERFRERVMSFLARFFPLPLTSGVTTMSGKTDVAKGRIKEAAGVLTGNDKLRTEGKNDQTIGEVKQVAEKAVDKVKQAVKKVRD
jgi:stearoyl-CoA desaturase (Delta-9 desaturase)